MCAYLVFDKGEEGVVEGLELFRLPDQGKALTVCTPQGPPHVHCTHTTPLGLPDTVSQLPCLPKLWMG